MIAERLLIIDTCGEGAGIALCSGGVLVCEAALPTGRASAEIVAVVRSLLTDARWKLSDVGAVGVVSGPGSFTGMRTGLAAAKGLCEAAGSRLIAVSRLEVLAQVAGLRAGMVALDAGRGQLYARVVSTGREWLTDADEIAALASGAEALVVGDTKAAAMLAARAPRLHLLRVGDALATILRAGRWPAVDAALVEANYVREEHDIYPAAARLTAR